MAPLSELLLLPPDAPLHPPRRSLVVRALAAATALAAALLFAVGLFYAGAEYGRATPHGGSAYGVSLRAVLNATWATALNSSRPAAPLALAASLRADCYAFTGGTCHMDPCSADRHSVCQSGLCMCDGSCTGADGACYQGTYPTIATGFTLTNKKFNSQRIYMPAFSPLDQLKTSDASDLLMFDMDKFNLHELPGTVVGKKDYFLSSVAYPDYVATIRATTGTAFSLFGAYEVSLHREFTPDNLAVQVCSKGGGQIMIGSVGKLVTEWFYIHHLSWEVYGTPLLGDGAVWISDPPIADGLLPVCS